MTINKKVDKREDKREVSTSVGSWMLLSRV